MRVLLPLMLFAAVPAAAQPDAPKRVATLLTADVDDFNVEGLTRIELMKLRFRLLESRPGLVSPLVMLGGGGALDVIGLSALVTAAVGISRDRSPWTRNDFNTGGKVLTGTAYATLVTGTLAVVVGTLLVACGAVRLSRYLPRRRLAAFKVELVEAELETLAAPPPAPIDAPPPAPP